MGSQSRCAVYTGVAYAVQLEALIKRQTIGEAISVGPPWIAKGRRSHARVRFDDNRIGIKIGINCIFGYGGPETVILYTGALKITDMKMQGMKLQQQKI